MSGAACMHTCICLLLVDSGGCTSVGESYTLSMKLFMWGFVGFYAHMWYTCVSLDMWTCVCEAMDTCLSHPVLSVAQRALESGTPEPYPTQSDQHYLCLNLLF